MPDLRKITDYREHEGYRRSFFRLAEQVFGIRFAEWHAAGFWSDEYTPHSFVHRGRVVANVSTNAMDLLLSGSRIAAVQIGTVMTHPDFRGRGLARELMQCVLDRCRSDDTFVYLLGDRRAAGFYRKLGLRSRHQSEFALQLPRRPGRPTPLHPLDRSADNLAHIHRMGANRRPVSRVFGVHDAAHILLWYCFNVLRGRFYRVPAHDAIAVCRRAGDTLHLYDLVHTGDIDLERVVRDLVPPDVRRVNFHFTPDQLDSAFPARPESDGDLLFAPPEQLSLVQKIFRHPATAQA